MLFCHCFHSWGKARKKKDVYSPFSQHLKETNCSLSPLCSWSHYQLGLGYWWLMVVCHRKKEQPPPNPFLSTLRRTTIHPATHFKLMPTTEKTFAASFKKEKKNLGFSQFYRIGTIVWSSCDLTVSHGRSWRWRLEWWRMILKFHLTKFCDTCRCFSQLSKLVVISCKPLEFVLPCHWFPFMHRPICRAGEATVTRKHQLPWGRKRHPTRRNLDSCRQIKFLDQTSCQRVQCLWWLQWLVRRENPIPGGNVHFWCFTSDGGLRSNGV